MRGIEKKVSIEKCLTFELSNSDHLDKLRPIIDSEEKNEKSESKAAKQISKKDNSKPNKAAVEKI